MTKSKYSLPWIDSCLGNMINFIFLLASQVVLTLRTITNGSEHMLKRALEMHIGSMIPISSPLKTITQIRIVHVKIKKQKSSGHLSGPLKNASGITTLRENGILKTDTLDKANICDRLFPSTFNCESNDEIPSKGSSLHRYGEIPSKGSSPFIAMGEI